MNAQPTDPTYLILRIFVVHRLKLHLSDDIRTRCLRISDLPEIERTWARLYTVGMLRKVGLLPLIIVPTVDTPIDLGEHFMWQIRIFWHF